MTIAFRLRTVGHPATDPMDLPPTMQSFHHRAVNLLVPPYRIRNAGQDWGEVISDLQDAQRVVHTRLQAQPIGYKVIMRGSAKDTPELLVHKVFDSAGDDVVRFALSQQGVRYVWADVDPKGGGSSGFDCSGLVLWCYEAGAGVIFPHSSAAIMADPQVIRCSLNQCRRGDLLAYNYGRLPSGTPDHIGLYISAGSSIDTRSTNEPVAVRPIDTGNLIACGYVPSVTGRH